MPTNRSSKSLKRFVVGLTGGIGCGKTAVSDYFLRHHIEVVDADVVAHTLSQQHSPLLDAIAQTFGDWVLDKQGNYNRPAMRDFVFANPQALAKLNAITHPIIVQTCLEQLEQTTSPYAILSAPLLIENKNNTPNLFDQCQTILVVDIPVTLQLERASLRDNTDKTRIQQIITQQIDRTTRLSYADHVVDNSQDLPHLYTQLATLHAHYLHLAQAN